MENNKNTQYELNKGLAQMLKGGVIMDVTTPEQARIAEAAGACAVMALERIPADIRAAGGVSRMSDPKMIKGIQELSASPSWRSAVSVTSWRLRYLRLSRLTTLMSLKCFHLLMMYTISIREISRCLSYVVQEISVRLSAVSTRELP